MANPLAGIEGGWMEVQKKNYIRERDAESCCLTARRLGFISRPYSVEFTCSPCAAVEYGEKINSISLCV